jgi:hypothetical protein
MVGTKLRANLRAGPDTSGTRASRTFQVVVAMATPIASADSPSHTASHRSALPARAASQDAATAEAPMATWPHPETAVNDPARSIVSRMKRRLSSALAWIGSGMGQYLAGALRFVKYFTSQTTRGGRGRQG